MTEEKELTQRQAEALWYERLNAEKGCQYSRARFEEETGYYVWKDKQGKWIVVKV